MVVFLNEFYPQSVGWGYRSQVGSFNAEAGIFNKCNTSTGVAIAMLPADAPEDNSRFAFLDVFGDGTGTGFAASNLIVNGNGRNIGDQGTLTLDVDNQYLELLYDLSGDRYLII